MRSVQYLSLEACCKCFIMIKTLERFRIVSFPTCATALNPIVYNFPFFPFLYQRQYSLYTIATPRKRQYPTPINQSPRSQADIPSLNRRCRLISNHVIVTCRPKDEHKTIKQRAAPPPTTTISRQKIPPSIIPHQSYLSTVPLMAGTTPAFPSLRPEGIPATDIYTGFAIDSLRLSRNIWWNFLHFDQANSEGKTVSLRPDNAYRPHLT